MNVTDTRVKCGNCGNYHESAQAVRQCYFPPKPVVPPVGAVAQSSPTVTRVTIRGGSYITNGATQAQIDYMIDLGGDPYLGIKYTVKGASLYIDRLKKEKRQREQAAQPSAVTNAPNRKTTKIPLAMLHEVPDGYYATRQDSTRPFTFFKISRPKSGNYKDTLKIMTQHGPDYKMALVIYPGDRIYWSNLAVEDDLLLVVVDWKGAGMAYAQEIGRCQRCNCELTDERSRWYGIGPECEKHRPWVITTIDDTKGPFRHGWEDQ